MATNATVAKNIPHIVSDKEKSKILDQSADSELDLMFWIAETYWEVSSRLQRELGGYVYIRQSDGKFVTTVHKSSLPKKDFQAQTGISAVFPDGYDGQGYKFKALWHTHISIKLHAKAGKSEQDAAADSNATHASNLWWGSDVRVMEKIREGGLTDVNGYIVSADSVIMYDPKYGMFGHVWLWPSRKELPR